MNDIRMIKCPNCGRSTAMRYGEFMLTYCEYCGITYGAERRNDEMIIYTVKESYRFNIE